MTRNCPACGLLARAGFCHNSGMDIYKNLTDVGIDADAVEAMRSTDDRESALILMIAHYDDRHEYV